MFSKIGKNFRANLASKYIIAPATIQGNKVILLDNIVANYRTVWIFLILNKFHFYNRFDYNTVAIDFI